MLAFTAYRLHKWKDNNKTLNQFPIFRLLRPLRIKNILSIDKNCLSLSTDLCVGFTVTLKKEKVNLRKGLE